jgi:hypothetical protein
VLDPLGGVHYPVKRQEMKPIPVLILFLDCPLTKKLFTEKLRLKVSIEIEIHDMKFCHMQPMKLAGKEFCLADTNPNVRCAACLELLFVNKRFAL